MKLPLVNRLCNALLWKNAKKTILWPGEVKNGKFSNFLIGFVHRRFRRRPDFRHLRDVPGFP